MAIPTQPSTRRPPLTRERALRAAIVVADAEGIERLTMRRLAQELGVEAMSLYHHVRNKDDILDGMVDLVFAEIELPAPNDPWIDAMRARSHSARATLVRHPWAVGLIDSRTSPGPATLRHHDAVIACLRSGGCPPAFIAHAMALLDSFVYGFVVQETTLPFDDGDDMHELVNEIVPDDFVERYPDMAAFTAEHVLRPGYSFSAEFDWGLDLILHALATAAR